VDVYQVSVFVQRFGRRARDPQNGRRELQE
jgi:hypothetical protein